MTDLSQRYPTHPRRRRLVAAVAALLGILGLAWTIWSGTVHATPDVAGRVKAFVITSDTDATATLTVDRRDPAQAARCMLYAQAQNYERVGEVTIDVAPGTVRVTDVPVSLRTFRRATTVVLDRCETA